MEQRDQLLWNSLLVHDKYFSAVISKIPEELYKHTVSEENSLVHSKYHKHKKVALTPDERKLLTKQRIADKYSGKNAVLKRKNDEAEPVFEPSVVEMEFAEPVSAPTPEISNDVNELRQRLQNRIMELKQQRNKSLSEDGSVNSSQNKQKKKDKKKEKKKNSNNKNNNIKNSTASDNKKRKLFDAEESAEGGNETKSQRTEKIGENMEFSTMLTSNSDNQPKSRLQKELAAMKGKPGAKKHRLEKLLKEAQNKREKIQTLKQSNTEESKQQLRTVNWNDALLSAAGEKVITLTNKSAVENTTSSEQRIKKALKRREEQKQKSAEQWKDRLDAVEESKQAKIQKREENISNRKNQGLGLVKVAGDKDDKTKNGGNNTTNGSRAGFEGKKKDGEYINSGSKQQHLSKDK